MTQRATARPRVGLLRRARIRAIRRLRRSRLLPVGMPDKVVDETRLGKPLAGEVIVFFATMQDTLYQLRPWYAALAALHEQRGLTVVLRDSRTERVVAHESGLPTITLATYAQLDEILAASDLRLALYVNHDPINFEALRFVSLAHVYLGHGDSDKGVSVSNQVKAYDYCFLAGEAALERTAANVMLYDAAARSLLIGQPQLDTAAVLDPAPSADPARPRTVLYAPTWEASQPSVSYGSVARSGEEIVRALLPSYRVVYRPHPLSGVISAEYARADAVVRGLADRVDTDVALERSFADADVLVTDVSAVPLSWLPSGKPLVVTIPEASYPASRLMETVPTWRPGDDLAAVVAAQLTSDAHRAERLALVRHYFGDTTPGAATAAFLRACGTVIDVRDRAWAQLGASGV